MTLFQPRVIAGAHEIPKLSGLDRVRLLRTVTADPGRLRRAGAVPGRLGWSIPRSAGVNLDELAAYLPRVAQVSVVPEVVDLIPESSWCASLANMLTASSWKVLRDVTTARAGGCEDCGAEARLECHELWSYDEERAVQKLLGLVALCGPCHETRHLGFATVRGRYEIARNRLVVLNRVRPAEVALYEREVFNRFVRRSKLEWVLDLSFLRDSRVNLKRAFELVAPGVVAGKAGSKGWVEATLSGVRIEAAGASLALG